MSSTTKRSEPDSRSNDHQQKKSKSTESADESEYTVHNTWTPLLENSHFVPTKKLESYEGLLELLLTKKVEDLRPPNNVIFVTNRKAKVTDVFKGLLEHRFLSAPVLQQHKHKYYGFVDLADIVRFVVDSFGASKLAEIKDFWKLLGDDDKFRNATVNEIMVYPLSRRNPFHEVNVGYSLFHAVEMMAKQVGLHHIPVVDVSRRLYSVITQSQIIHLLFFNMELLGNKKKKTVREIVPWIGGVPTVTTKQTAIDAFKLMTERNVGGVCVVDNDGKMVDALSLRDLKGIGVDGTLFYRLFQSVHHFLQEVSRLFAEANQRPREPVQVKLDDTLEKVITLIHLNRIHRVFVVDDHQKPVAVVELAHILKEIITF